MDLGPAVVIEDRPGRGRCAIAGRSFCAGDVILAESPLAHVLHHAQWGQRCHGCLQSSWDTGSRETPHSRLFFFFSLHSTRVQLAANVRVSSCQCLTHLRSTDSIFCCGGCKRYLYCSRTCAEVDWQRGHYLECGVLGRMGDSIRPDAVELLLLAR